MKILSISDLHFGHNKLPSDILYARLKKYTYSYINTVNFITICGDVFDTLLNMDTESAYYATLWINDIVELASANDIPVRCVRGTFSHDRNQTLFFQSKHQKYNVKVFNHIAIEYIDTLGINCLYIPDNLPYENPIIVIKKLIKDSGLKHVDVVIGHGQFEHTLPRGISQFNTLNCFTVDQFKDIVTGPILFGHIHTKSVYRNVLYNGSFDRLAHGEEESKGFFIVDYNKETHKSTFEFIENEDATIFITFKVNECNDDALDEVRDIDNLIIGFQEWLSDRVLDEEQIFHLRIIDSDIDRRSALGVVATNTYPNAIVTYLSSKDKTEEIDEFELGLLNSDEVLPEINTDNIPVFIQEYVKDEFNVMLDLEEIEKVLVDE